MRNRGEELEEKRDCVIQTSISTVALEKTAQLPDGRLDTPSHQVRLPLHVGPLADALVESDLP